MYKRNNLLFYMLLIVCSLSAKAQRTYTIKSLEPPPIKSIRGMYAVNDSVLWVSGTQGKAGLTTDGGKHWKWITVKGYDTCDWRTLYAFSSQRALLLNAGEPASIMLTTNAGETWTSVYHNSSTGIFFDGMTFRNKKEGVAIGDPLNGEFVNLHTTDGGESWTPGKDDPIIPEKGEAIFAASNSSITTFQDGKACFVTGGTVSRFFSGWNKWTSIPLPMTHGSAATGPFSVAFFNRLHGVIAGGDYMHDTITEGNCVITEDGGLHWKAPVTPPRGYRSCVKYISDKVLIATGTSGTDISEDGGMHWKKISDTGFHVIAVSPGSKHVWLAGKERIAELVIY